MLWYNNPEAVIAVHEEAIRRHLPARRRRSLRLVPRADLDLG